jgi:hypothetical protein
LSEQEQIENLKSRFRSTLNTETRKQVFDVLATYGNEGVAAILSLTGTTANDDLKSYGLSLVKKTRESMS